MQSVMRMKKGMFLGRIAPYGYRKDPDDVHHLIIHEGAAKVVKDIYNWFAVDKLYVSEITRKLNNLEIPSPSVLMRLNSGVYPENRDRYANLWTQATVGKILKNPIYLGHMVQGRFQRKDDNSIAHSILPEEEWIIVKNTHDPIIEQEIFDLAKRRFYTNRRYRSTGSGDNEFLGLLRCPDCGFAMARFGHHSRASRGFQCSTHRDKLKTACTPHKIRVMDLREAVFNTIKARAGMAQRLYDTFDELCGTPKILDEIRLLSSELHEREREYEEAINRKAAIYMDWKNGRLEKKAHDQEKTALDGQIQKLGNTIDALGRDRETVSQGIDFVQSNLEMFLKYTEITSLDRCVLVDLVDVIYVHEGGRVEVNFLFNEEFESVKDFIGRFS